MTHLIGFLTLPNKLCQLNLKHLFMLSILTELTSTHDSTGTDEVNQFP
uniref:Uncharacterized protein n=1 Tax=Rhizophora mucronata TaxID=61149 RepID=A0A2P2P0X3_RHIMU